MYSVRTNVDARTLARNGVRSWSWAAAFVAWIVIAVLAITLGDAYVSQYRKERVQEATQLAAVAAEALEQSLLRSVEAMESIQSLTQTRVNLERAGDRAGAVAIGELLRVPGGSRLLIEAQVPYDEGALATFLGFAPAQASSAWTTGANQSCGIKRRRSMTLLAG